MNTWCINLALMCHLFTVSMAGSLISNNNQRCLMRTLTCIENGNVRCLQPNEICNESVNCSGSLDRTACEKALSQFAVTSFVQPVKQPDITLENITLQACAKICYEEESFSCVGFQHHFESHNCRLLDGKHTQRNKRPAPTVMWITYELLSATIPSSNGNDVIFTDERQGRGIETDLDSIVVEAADLPGLRFKRQAFNFPDVFSPVSNLFNNRGRAANLLPESDAISSESCGSRSVSFDPPRRGARIVNGVVPPYGAYPWQVQIQRRDNKHSSGWKHICGGSIISSTHVLTAIHCLMGYRESEFRIRVGQQDLNIVEAEEQIFNVISYKHPGSYGSEGWDVGDIAIVLLSSPIKFGSKVAPICLPSSESVYQPDTWCEVSGWGNQKADDVTSVSEVLRVAAVPIIASNTCSKKEVYGSSLTKRFVPDSMICAGFLKGGIDSCSGDSGGPFACKVNGHYELLGIVSWGEGCASVNKPGVYTKVLHYLDWIKKTIAKM